VCGGGPYGVCVGGVAFVIGLCGGRGVRRGKRVALVIRNVERSRDAKDSSLKDLNRTQT
jgi:hypothetical protein